MTKPLSISHYPTTDVLVGAFDKHLVQMRGLPAERVVKRINVDVPAAVSIVLGAQAAVASMRRRMVEEMPKFDVRNVDDLGSLAYATLYVHISHTIQTVDSSGQLSSLMEAATPLRKTLASDAAAAVQRGLLDADALANIPTGAGRLDTARALLGLGVAFRGAWPKVKGRTGVTEEEMEKAAQLGVAILTALGTEDNPSVSDAKLPLEDLRLRSYTLLYQAYDECRRAIAFLRWHEEDAGDFAPSLTGSRGPRAKKDDAKDDAKKDDETAKGGEATKGGEGKGGEG